MIKRVFLHEKGVIKEPGTCTVNARCAICA